MSNLAAIREAIVAKLSAVPGIGIVHNRERYARNESEFQAHYLYELGDGTTALRGWYVRRMTTQELSGGLGGRGIDEHVWHLRGYWAFNDEEASEIAFDECIEQFRDDVRADPTLGLGQVCTTQWSGEDGESELIEVLDVGNVLFCGVLCHSALLQLRTRSYV
jgi:hypothetical protein